MKEAHTTLPGPTDIRYMQIQVDFYTKVPQRQ